MNAEEKLKDVFKPCEGDRIVGDPKHSPHYDKDKEAALASVDPRKLSWQQLHDNAIRR